MYTYEKNDKQGVLKVKISKQDFDNAVQNSY